MKYEEAKNLFRNMVPKWQGYDPAYDSLVVSLGRSEKDKTKAGDKREMFINQFIKYRDELVNKK